MAKDSILAPFFLTRVKKKKCFWTKNFTNLPKLSTWSKNNVSRDCFFFFLFCSSFWSISCFWKFWPRSLKNHFWVKTFHGLYKLQLHLITQYTNQRKKHKCQGKPKKALNFHWVCKNLKHIIENNTYNKNINLHIIMSVGGKVLPARFCWLSIGKILMVKSNYDKKWLLTAFLDWKWHFFLFGFCCFVLFLFVCLFVF